MSTSVPEQPTDGSPRLLSHLFFSEALDARDRSSAWSFAAAVLLHILVLALALSPVGHHLLKTETDPGVGTGIGAGAAGGGGGGRDEQLIALQAPPAPAEGEIEVPPPPPPAVDMPVIEPPKLPQLAMASVQTTTPAAVSAGAASTGGSGTGAGAGTGPGTGPGSGGGSGGGEGGGIGSGVGPGIGRGRILAPKPEFVLLPPTPTPGPVKGKSVVVRLAIDAGGMVRDVELIPSTGDRGFDQALRRTAMAWHFQPARDAANRAVAVTYDVTFDFSR